MAYDVHSNFDYSTVLTAPVPATTGTSLVVQSGQGSLFATPPFNATVWPAGAQPTAANAEIVRVTNISTDTFTITRAQESSTARTVVVGDQIAATITAKSLTDIETFLYNPYKFHAYRNAAQNAGNGAFAIINFDTEFFDTNNNFDVTTNVGRYTAPVAGFYQFNARFSSAAGANTIIALFKNGSIYQRGGHTTGAGTNGPTYNNLVQSAAGDYWEIFSFAGGGALEVGSNGLYVYFSGFLVSQT